MSSFRNSNVKYPPEVEEAMMDAMYEAQQQEQEEYDKMTKEEQEEYDANKKKAEEMVLERGAARAQLMAEVQARMLSPRQRGATPAWLTQSTTCGAPTKPVA